MKVIGPLLSLEARGRFAGVLTFSQRKSGSQVRFQRQQKDVITSSRTTQRNKFIQAKEMWPLNDFGVIQFGFNMVGGQYVNISSRLLRERAPKFALWVSDVLKFYS